MVVPLFRTNTKYGHACSDTRGPERIRRSALGARLLVSDAADMKVSGLKSDYMEHILARFANKEASHQARNGGDMAVRRDEPRSMPDNGTAKSSMSIT